MGDGVFEIDEGKTMTLNAANPLRGSAPLNKGGDGTLVITGSGATMTGSVMASGPITSWEIDEETVTDFKFSGLQNHCRW